MYYKNNDLVAYNIGYHTECLHTLRHESEKVERQESQYERPPPFDQHGVAEVKDILMHAEKPAMTLAALINHYVDIEVRSVNSSRFKEHLRQFPGGWVELKSGRNVLITLATTAGQTVESSMKDGVNDLLDKAAECLRNTILDTQIPSFNGTFEDNCLIGNIPKLLLRFVKRVLQGPKSSELSHLEKDKDLSGRTKAACMISYLLVFNTLKGPSSSNMIRYSKELETPIPLYLSLKFHGKTRAKSTINVLHDAGLDVSYTRAHEVRKDIAQAVCKRHSEDGIVLPTTVRQCVFSTMHFDNLDRNKRSNLSNNDFHGSCITITNHLSHEIMGQKRTPVVIDPTDDKTEIRLL